MYSHILCMYLCIHVASCIFSFQNAYVQFQRTAYSQACSSDSMTSGASGNIVLQASGIITLLLLLEICALIA